MNDCMALTDPIMDKKEYCIREDEQCNQQEKLVPRDTSFSEIHIVLMR